MNMIFIENLSMLFLVKYDNLRLRDKKTIKARRENPKNIHE